MIPNTNLRGRAGCYVLLMGLILVLAAIGAPPALAQGGDFEQPVTSPEGAGTSPFSIAVGDFNRDSRRDLAVANLNSRDVTILLGDGTGNFNPAPTGPEAAGDRPRSIAVGDFNGDSRSDLAVANEESSDVSILLGDGTGDFTAAPTGPETAGDAPTSIAVGDFNQDSRQDLVIANQSSNDVTILLGAGTGNFSPAPTGPEAAGDFPTSVAVGDFNGDSRPDLAVANLFSGDVTILLGDGTGNFSPAPTGPEAAGFSPSSVALGDFNRDSHLDLAVANRDSNDITILLGNSTGDFAPAPTGPESAGDRPRSVAVGEFNGDSRPDLAIANQSSNDVTILLGDGTGNFTPAPTSPEGVGTSPFSIGVGDFNGDSRSDLAVANASAGNVTILLARVAGQPQCTMRRGAGNDIVRGTPGRDVICTGAGNDIVYGLGGGDVIRGGPGNDIVRGDAGNDRLEGGSGNDKLIGGAGNDRLIGGTGADTLSGQDGRDSLDARDGGRGNDLVDGGPGSDSCFRDPGDVHTSC